MIAIAFGKSSGNSVQRELMKVEEKIELRIQWIGELVEGAFAEILIWASSICLWKLKSDVNISLSRWSLHELTEKHFEKPISMNLLWVSGFVWFSKKTFLFESRWLHFQSSEAPEITLRRPLQTTIEISFHGVIQLLNSSKELENSCKRFSAATNIKFK